MASFDGTDLGPFAHVRTMSAPVGLQVNSYPGVNGLEVLYMGGRGGTSEATGACVATDLATLASVEGTFRTYQYEATVGILVDTEGTSWDDVILLSFEPVGPISFVAGYGWGREYHMTFLHMS